MNCAEFESIVADYLDGTLGSTERAAVEQHASTCGACHEFLQEVSGAVAFLGQAEEVLPPPELVTRLAYLAPVGRTRRPFESQGLFSRLTTQWLQPILQPRLVMGMAMTVLSFAMLERCTGIQVQHIQPSDLSPARVWDGVEDKALRVKDRAVKYYENIRLVYEVETRLKDLEADQSGTDGASETGPAAKQSGSGKSDGNQK
jgi:hypothetical protein